MRKTEIIFLYSNQMEIYYIIYVDYEKFKTIRTTRGFNFKGF